jgi:hypothetical protein
MDIDEAKKLAETLRTARAARGQSQWTNQLWAHVVEDEPRMGVVLDATGRPRRGVTRSARIIFEGGKRGPHSLDVATSSRERILLHWTGYVISSRDTSGLRVGASVRFMRGKYGWYEGKVVKLGRLIATIRYRMKNGGLAKWTAPTTDVVVLPRAGRLTVD